MQILCRQIYVCNTGQRQSVVIWDIGISAAHPQLYVCAPAALGMCTRSSTYVHPQLYVCLLRIRSYRISGYLLHIGICIYRQIYVCNTGQRQSVHQVVWDIGISAAHSQLPVHPLVCYSRIV
jgi:hypothetical protein